MEFELVVAHWREDLAWLRRVRSEFRVTVYTKEKDLPNTGREAGTYFHHLITRYESLADVTVFCQGKPFDHAFDFHRSLRELASGEKTVRDFHWFGHILDTDDAQGRLFRAWSKNEEGEGLDFANFFQQVWNEAAPQEMMFALGAQFSLTRACALARSVEFYQRAAKVAAEFPHAAHCFERTWDRVFGVDGIPPESRAKGPTVYLKPIRRLLTTD